MNTDEEIEAIKAKITHAGYKKVPHINDDFTWKLLLETNVLTGPEISYIRDAILSSVPTSQPTQGK